MPRKPKRLREETDTSTPKKQQTLEEQIKACELNIATWDLESKRCMGPTEIIKMKSLLRKIEEEKHKIEYLKDSTNREVVTRELSLQIAKLKANDIISVAPARSRLLPLQTSLKVPPSEVRARNIRGHEKRFALLSGNYLEPRRNLVDMCVVHNVERVIDKETARRICPKCGNTQKYETHIFELKDNDKEEGISASNQSLVHMQKFSAQFEQGHPPSTLSTLEKMSVSYMKIHTMDASKAQSSKTAQLLKTTDIPKNFKKAPDRLTKELRADSIPEFTAVEINTLLNQRSQLRIEDEMDADGTKKKSYSNSIYIRQLGLANLMHQSRLFTNAKTQKVHQLRCATLENLVEQQRLSQKPGDTTCWQLQPFS